jgi:hypothetical protein
MAQFYRHLEPILPAIQSKVPYGRYASASIGIYFAFEIRQDEVNVTSRLLTLVKTWPLRCVGRYATWEFRFGMAKSPRSKDPRERLRMAAITGLERDGHHVRMRQTCMNPVKREALLGFGQPAAVELPSI